MTDTKRFTLGLLAASEQVDTICQQFERVLCPGQTSRDIRATATAFIALQIGGRPDDAVFMKYLMQRLGELQGHYDQGPPPPPDDT